MIQRRNHSTTAMSSAAPYLVINLGSIAAVIFDFFFPDAFLRYMQCSPTTLTWPHVFFLSRLKIPFHYSYMLFHISTFYFVYTSFVFFLCFVFYSTFLILILLIVHPFLYATLYSRSLSPFRMPFVILFACGSTFHLLFFTSS